MKYEEYLSAASETEKTEALADLKPPEDFEEITLKKPDVETKTVGAKTVEEKIAEKTVEPSAMKIEPVLQKEEVKPVLSQATAETTEETEEGYGETFEEEEVNPQDATPELVEKLAARGQFGTAYKVCKMLKVKNPTDAKVDRKILELKRLYVWSSQMVG